MRVEWAPEAFDDLQRVYDFLAVRSRPAADRAFALLTASSQHLAEMPRGGSRVETFSDLEVRRVLVGQYEIRYRIEGDMLLVLRIFHTREDR